MGFRYFPSLVISYPSVLVVLVASLAVDSALGQKGVAVKKQLPNPALSQLSLAYQESSSLTPVERGYFFFELTSTALEIKHPQTVEWVRQALSEVSQLPLSWNRCALQKNFLIFLSAYDPSAAMQQLAGMPFPCEAKLKLPSEDVRADAAKKVFASSWRQAKDLNLIQSTASALGESGQFPYLAIAPIVADVSQRDPILADQLFVTATEYFRRRNPTASNTPEYISFIKRMDGIVRPGLLVDGVQAAANRLLDEKQDLFGDESYQGLNETADGSIKTTSRRDHLMLELLPLISRLDSPLASRILEAHPKLTVQSAAANTYSSTIVGSASPEQQEKLHARNMQRERLNRIKQMTASQWEEAQEELAKLSDVDFRADALADMSTKLASVKPDVAARYQAEITRLLKDKSSPRQRLTIYVALARAAAARKDTAAFHDAFVRSLDLGMQSMQLEADSKTPVPVVELAAYEDLCELVRVGAGLDPTPTFVSLDNLTLVQEAKPYLRVCAVRGMKREIPFRTLPSSPTQTTGDR